MRIKAPGLIDIHSHLRDPGFEYKEDIQSGSLAALTGGYTTIVCMANTSPVLDTPERIRAQIKRFETLPARLCQAAAATIGQQGRELTDFAALKSAGAAAISDDGQAILDAKVMYDALQAAKAVGLPLMTHSEDARIPGRGAAAEEYMVARDLTLAKYADAPVHIQHVTTAKSADLIRQAKRGGTAVTCETCAHYFMFTEDLRRVKGAIAKVFPPLRTQRDVEAIIEALADGTIDIIATDHAPHSREEKARDWDSAPGGMIGLETTFAASLTALYHSGALTLPQLLAKFTDNPRELLGLPKTDDYIEFDSDEEWTLTEADIKSKSSNSPFIGITFRGRIKETVCVK
ncbi:MAG: dihydroorotase [Oscillospiraceae bacterium]|jgi:dihydroorotase|nr:dihydroorotase [Oscillospiraceae bacterium]